MPDAAPAPHHLTVVSGTAAQPGPVWEQQYRDNVGPVYRFVFSRLGNRPDAEDVTAQVFLAALPHLANDRSAGEIRNYLFRTARTKLADFWREEYGVVMEEWDDRRIEGVASVTAPAQPQPRPAVAEMLEKLSQTAREVLELRFLRGYSIRETANELGMSPANVKVTQWRALKRAAELLKDVEP